MTRPLALALLAGCAAADAAGWAELHRARQGRDAMSDSGAWVSPGDTRQQVVVTAAMLANRAWQVARPTPGGVEANPGARVILRTDAPYIVVTVGVIDSLRSDKWHVCGVGIGTTDLAAEPTPTVELRPTAANALTQIQVPLPGVVAGTPVRVDVVGTQRSWITWVDAPIGAVFEVLPQPAGPVLTVVGDSIVAGSTVNTGWPTADGWTQRLRRAVTTEQVTIHGRGGNSLLSYGYTSPGGTLATDATNVALRNAFRAEVASTTPARIWVALGTNDWTNNRSVADVRRSLRELVLNVHADTPGALVWVQSPIFRAANSAETTANSQGATLPDIRQAEADAVTDALAIAAGDWCTYVSGLDVGLVAGDLWDGLHPTPAGYAKYATWALTVPGLVP